MEKEYRRTSFIEIIKGEVLGLIFGFIGALIVVTVKKESPSSLFYIIPAILGLVSLLVDLIGNLRPLIKIDQEKITRYKFSLLKKNRVAVALPWQRIKSIDLSLAGPGFLKYKIRLTLKSDEDECLMAVNTQSDFSDLLKEVFSRAVTARFTPQTGSVVKQHFKELLQLNPNLSTQTA
jgi:hypothetical protein